MAKVIFFFGIKRVAKILIKKVKSVYHKQLKKGVKDLILKCLVSKLVKSLLIKHYFVPLQKS